MKDFVIEKSQIFSGSITIAKYNVSKWTFLRITHNGLTLFVTNNNVNNSIFSGMDLDRIKINSYKLKIIGMDHV
jgi:hypothetical protein